MGSYLCILRATSTFKFYYLGVGAAQAPDVEVHLRRRFALVIDAQQVAESCSAVDTARNLGRDVRNDGVVVDIGRYGL